MAVRINKPSTNIREKLAELERPIGLNGSALMRTETPQDARNLLGVGRKNALYNGSMQIWQRGTSFLGLGSGGVANYTADRWGSNRYSSANNNTTREDANYLGFRYCLRSARPSGDTTGTSRYVHQVLEQIDTWKLRSNYITFSFYARVGSGYSGSNIASFITYHIDSTKEERFYYNAFMTAVNYGTTKNHASLSTNWQRYTHNIFLPANAQQVGVSIGTPEALPTAVANDYFEITGCQLEVGSVATDFEHRSIGEELALCQRYCQNFSGRIAQVNVNSGTGGVGRIPLSPPMRITPAIHSYTAGNLVREGIDWHPVSAASISGESTNNNFVFAISTSSNTGLSVGNTTHWGNGATLILSAEL